MATVSPLRVFAALLATLLTTSVALAIWDTEASAFQCRAALKGIIEGKRLRSNVCGVQTSRSLTVDDVKQVRLQPSNKQQNPFILDSSTSTWNITPTVQLDSGTFTGKAGFLISSFFGIPYALPPVGKRRFRLPEPHSPYNGTYSAHAYGPACIQVPPDIASPPGVPARVIASIRGQLFSTLLPESEDCLTLNVVKPASTNEDSKLPVLVWIFGGGFTSGGTDVYNGGSLVTRSVEMGRPVVYVSLNYRLNGFGFLPGKEAREAGIGNLGLQDQRLALQWVQKYIHVFGGDPSKVILWGESAGAVSATLHMLSPASRGLFHGVFAQSGAPVPTGQIDSRYAQSVFDNIAQKVGCKDTESKLECLRSIEALELKKAIESVPGMFSYHSLNAPWIPRADGVFLTAPPQHLVRSGSILPNIPTVLGNCDDEGTLFALSILNLTTTSQLRTWLAETYMPHVSPAELERVLELYPLDPIHGSPFDTGVANVLTPQYKRTAALQGDIVFQAPRRYFAERLVERGEDVWIYLSKRHKGTPALGAAHAHDLSNVYGGGELEDALVRFAHNLDPGAGGLIPWPRFDLEKQQIITFYDGLLPSLIRQDTYREEEMQWLTELSLRDPL